MRTSSLLLLLAAALPLVSAGKLPYKPRSTLQRNKDSRDVYRKRQATRAGIVRREKQGPRRRQISNGVCYPDERPSGVNLIQNGNFEKQSNGRGNAPVDWAVTKNRDDFDQRFDAGYQGSDCPANFGFAVYQADYNMLITLTQSVSLTAGLETTVAFNFGAQPQGGPTTCTVTATLGDQPLFSGTPCDATYPCTLRTTDSDNGGYVFRYQQTSFVPETTGTAVMSFQWDCPYSDRGAYTGVDNVFVGQSGTAEVGEP